ncbi:UNVERIFIED_CONTAM: hypothetical protein K2H54_052311 [Gekko kuhli]
METKKLLSTRAAEAEVIASDHRCAAPEQAQRVMLLEPPFLVDSIFIFQTTHPTAAVARPSRDSGHTGRAEPTPRYATVLSARLPCPPPSSRDLALRRPCLITHPWEGDVRRLRLESAEEEGSFSGVVQAGSAWGQKKPAGCAKASRAHLPASPPPLGE